MTPELARIQELCLSLTKRSDPKMKWTWGEGLLGYAFLNLDDYLATELFTPFLTQYCNYYVQHRPQIASSDTCSPGLITFEMWKKTQNEDYRYLTESVVDYILHEPRLVEGVPNHFGHNSMSRFYPKSIWVDSLMMFSIFPAIFAQETGDKVLLEYAAGLPKVFAKYLQDGKTGLWQHSYWVNFKRTYPGKNIFWGRGNGWVMAALPMLLDRLDEDNPHKKDVIAIFQKTADGIVSCQRENGLFGTLLLEKSYDESSCTALIAAGFFAGIRQGILPKEKYLVPAQKAFAAVMSQIKPDSKGDLVFSGISGPTIPLWPCPKLNYRLIKKKGNWSYGVAALIFAGIEFDRSQKR